jgi:hypothetical protein
MLTACGADADGGGDELCRRRFRGHGRTCAADEHTVISPPPHRRPLRDGGDGSPQTPSGTADGTTRFRGRFRTKAPTPPPRRPARPIRSRSLVLRRSSPIRFPQETSQVLVATSPNAKFGEVDAELLSVRRTRSGRSSRPSRPTTAATAGSRTGTRATRRPRSACSRSPTPAASRPTRARSCPTRRMTVCPPRRRWPTARTTIRSSTTSSPSTTTGNRARPDGQDPPDGLGQGRRNLAPPRP